VSFTDFWRWVPPSPNTTSRGPDPWWATLPSGAIALFTVPLVSLPADHRLLTIVVFDELDEKTEGDVEWFARQ
jgi:hypothetical protein